jgi:virginiamycin B lyase
MIPRPITGPALLWLLFAMCVPSFSQYGFALIPGSLSQVSVGADGAVWGLDSSQNVYTWDPATNQFVQVPGALTQIAVGNADAVWGINAQQLIFHWDSVNQQWIYVPGSLSKIAVGADGDVWGINAQSQVWHYDQQQHSWQYLPVPMIDIAVGSAGAVYGLGPVVNYFQNSYWYNPGTGQFQATGVETVCNGNFVGILLLTQISAGIDGDVWAVGTGFTCNTQNVAYHYDPSEFTWYATASDLFPGTLVQVAVGTGADAWGVDALGGIYHYNARTASWEGVPGSLKQIAVGGDGSVWGVDAGGRIFKGVNLPRPYQTLIPVVGTFTQMSVGADSEAWAVDSANLIYKFDPSTQSWQNVPGALTQIAAGGGQNAAGGSSNTWGLNAAGQIWQWGKPFTTPRDWNYISGELVQVAAGADGSVWGINAGSQTYTYDSSAQSWTNIPGELAQLSVGADGSVWGINASQQIYRFDPTSQFWVNVPGSLVQISVGSAKNVWGVNAQGEIYTYDPAKGWVKIPGTLQQVKAAFDGSVWGVNPDGGLYQWNAATQSFNFVADGFTDVFVGNAVSVWAINITTGFTYMWF